MTVTVAGTKPSAPAGLTAVSAFPRTAVETCLRDELVESVKAEAGIKGIALPNSSKGVAKTSFHVDSLVVVAILCAVEPIVGFELPETVVRPGGYGSVEKALEHLIPRIEEQWTKRKGGKP